MIHNTAYKLLPSNEVPVYILAVGSICTVSRVPTDVLPAVRYRRTILEFAMAKRQDRQW